MESPAAFISLLERFSPSGLKRCHLFPEAQPRNRMAWVLYLKDVGGNVRGMFVAQCDRQNPDSFSVCLTFEIWMLTEVVPPSQDIGVPANEGRQYSMLRLDVSELSSSTWKTIWRGGFGHGLSTSGYDIRKCMRRVLTKMHPLVDMLWNNPRPIYENVLDPSFTEVGDDMIGDRAERLYDSIYWEPYGEVYGTDVSSMICHNYTFLSGMSLCDLGYERRYQDLGFGDSLLEVQSVISLSLPAERPEIVVARFERLLRDHVPSKVQLVVQLWATMDPTAKGKLAYPGRFTQPKDWVGHANSEASRLISWVVKRAAKETVLYPRGLEIIKSCDGFLNFYGIKTRYVQEAVEVWKSQNRPG